MSEQRRVDALGFVFRPPAPPPPMQPPTLVEIDEEVRKAVHCVRANAISLREARRTLRGVPHSVMTKLVAGDEFTPTECLQMSHGFGGFGGFAEAMRHPAAPLAPVAATSLRFGDGVVRFVLVKINKENERVLLRIFSSSIGGESHRLEGFVANATCVRVIEAEFLGTGIDHTYAS